MGCVYWPDNGIRLDGDQGLAAMTASLSAQPVAGEYLSDSPFNRTFSHSALASKAVISRERVAGPISMAMNFGRIIGVNVNANTTIDI